MGHMMCINRSIANPCFIELDYNGIAFFFFLLISTECICIVTSKREERKSKTTNSEIMKHTFSYFWFSKCYLEPMKVVVHSCLDDRIIWTLSSWSGNRSGRSCREGPRSKRWSICPTKASYHLWFTVENSRQRSSDVSWNGFYMNAITS